MTTIDVLGTTTWCTETGAGDETVLLLHGGLSSSAALLDALAGPLAPRYRVVAFDRRGHGHTPDSPAPFHYRDMATETIAVLERVVRGRAHLVGWSDGGIVALHVALERPDLVGRLVVVGTNYHHDGLLPLPLDPQGPLAAAMAQEYAALSPDGLEHLPVVVEKFMTMIAAEPELSTADLARIGAPTLVVAADDDGVRLDHTCALYEGLPAGQLAVVPGASHALPLERPATLAGLVLDFLGADLPPVTLLPLRRAPAVAATP